MPSVTAMCLGIAQQSRFLCAVGLQNNDAVEDLLIARADVNYSPLGCGKKILAGGIGVAGVVVGAVFGVGLWFRAIVSQ